MADWLGASAQPVLGLRGDALPDGAQVLPAEAGADRLTGRAIPHDGRGALRRDADGVDGPALLERPRWPARSPRRRAARHRTRRARGTASTAGAAGGAPLPSVASGRMTAARTPVVPMSITRTLTRPSAAFARRWWSPRSMALSMARSRAAGCSVRTAPLERLAEEPTEQPDADDQRRGWRGTRRPAAGCRRSPDRR